MKTLKITENARVALAASGFISVVMLCNYITWFA
jgi:hypothetical protein